MAPSSWSDERLDRRRLLCVVILALSSCLCTASLTSEVAAEDLSCPVQLLSIESTGARHGSVQEHDEDSVEELHLNEEGLRYLRNLPSPLYIVPMLGVYRGGKSLVLNRLMGLQAPYEQGFGVGHGQDTHTRGIHMCSEYVDGLGSIVWMDTEGLFSAEDARSAHGPKIFSLALLYSSTVLLNSVKVFNDQFFAFFGQQQQVARVLKQGLSAEGLPHSSLLPSNLSIFWILSQPVEYDATGRATEAQLRTFLNANGDELRHHVQRDFSHRHIEVPVATDDVKQWGHLDQLDDDELSWSYITAVRELRSRVLAQLRHARPLQATSIAKQLQIYVEAVQAKRFSISLAKEAFEEEQVGKICDEYGRRLAQRVGELPSSNIQDQGVGVMEELQPVELAAIAEFHFTASWSQRLKSCMQGKLVEMKRKNQDAVVQRWQAAAGRIAAGASCFFLSDLVVLRDNYTMTYGEDFEAETRERAEDYASALQRTKLAECLRLKDVLLPFLPWSVWPVLSLYTRDRLISGLLMACCHGVVLVGLYAVGQMFDQLPPYLNVDYHILRGNPLLVDLLMNAPPMVPWATAMRVCWGVGAVWSAYKFLRHLAHMAMLPGDSRTSSGLLAIELKLNRVEENQAKVLQIVEAEIEQLKQLNQKWEDTQRHIRALSMALAPRGSDGKSHADPPLLGARAGSNSVAEPITKPALLVSPTPPGLGPTEDENEPDGEEPAHVDKQRSDQQVDEDDSDDEDEVEDEETTAASARRGCTLS